MPLATRLRHALQHPHLPWHLAVLAIVLSAPSLWLRWAGDDYIHRAALVGLTEFPEASRSPAGLFAFIRGDVEANRRAVDRGFWPWWATDNLRLAFFRPVTGLTHWIDYKIWPETPFLMHIQSLAWFGCAVAAAAALYRRMLGATWVAGLAALMFAVDDAHGLPAAYLANRNATGGVLFGLLALIAHDQWRRGGRRTGALLAPSALVLGLLANEGALATGAYLAAYALFVDRDTPLRRLCSLAPCAIVGAVWCLAYKQMGYGAVGSAMYIDPVASPLCFAQAVVERAPILLFGQWAFPSDLQLMLSQRAGHVMWLIALGFIVAVAALLAPLLRRDRVARFWAVGMILAVLPVCATTPSDRLLFFVGIGGMGLLAQFVAAVLQRTNRLPTRARWRLPARVLCFGFIVVHLGLAPVGLTLAAENVRAFGRVIDRAAASLPSDAAVRDQRVLIVNAPTAFVCAYAPFIQALNGKAVPGRVLVLGSGIYSIELYRRDERTLVVRPEGGFLAPPGSPRPGHEADQAPFSVRYVFPAFDGLFRDSRPMRIGHRIELTGVTVEVTVLTQDGRPAEVAFRFATVLEDPSLRWLQWEDGVYTPFAVPAVAETVTLPAATAPL